MLNNHINEILSDICNFQLVVFGIAISLFTLLYSFMMNRREQLKILSDKIKSGNTSPEIIQRIEFSKSYISRLKRTNIHLIIISILSLFVYLFSWFAMRIIDCITVKTALFYISSSLTVAIIIYIILILWHVFFKEYSKSTKI